MSNLNRCKPLAEFPPARRAVAFRAIESVLREDPTLARMVRTWRSREGKASEMEKVPISAMPAISLSPVPRPNSLLAIDLLEANFAVSVQIFVPGTCYEDVDAVWDAVEAAIVKEKPFRPGVPGQETVREYLAGCMSARPTGVRALWATEPAFFGVDLRKAANKDATQCQVGIGYLAGQIIKPA